MVEEKYILKSFTHLPGADYLFCPAQIIFLADFVTLPFRHLSNF